MIQGIDFSITCVLGLVSLMRIIVRNGIIMIDYAEELRSTERLEAAEAIYQSARRRMRPIFLTSAAVLLLIFRNSSQMREKSEKLELQ